MHRVKGRVCSRTIRDKEGRQVIYEGEIITNTVLQNAEAAGVLHEVIACAGVTTMPPRTSTNVDTNSVVVTCVTWQPTLPPAAQEVIDDEGEDDGSTV
jgi:peptidyl-tRNA hydrolase